MTPAERLERWKRSLLDLSKRNRLLNLKTSASALPIFCPDIAALEDMIAQGARIAMIPPRRSAPPRAPSTRRSGCCAGARTSTAPSPRRRWRGASWW